MSLTGVVNSSSGFSPTFAAELRERSDEDLEKLFTLRPDLITPIPADMSSLLPLAPALPLAFLEPLKR